MDSGVPRLLIADSDSSVRDIILYSSREEGWLADEARDGIEAIKLLRRHRYGILILELELPVIDGLIVCEQFGASVPVIFLSRRTSERDRLDAFQSGGNDFLPKPFYPRELVARIRSFLRLTGHKTADQSVLQAGDLRIDMNSQDVYIEDRLIRLTPREYSLLLFLSQNPNKAYSRESLLNMVWGHQYEGMDRTVDTHIKSLREKIRPCDKYIVTIWGCGYKMVL